MYQSSASQVVKKKSVPMKIEESRFRFEFDDFSNLNGSLDSTKVELLSIDAVWWVTITTEKTAATLRSVPHNHYTFQVRLEAKTAVSFDVISKNFKFQASAMIGDIKLMSSRVLRLLEQKVLSTEESFFSVCSDEKVPAKLNSIVSSGASLVVEFVLSATYNQVDQINQSYCPTLMKNEIVANSSKMLESSTLSDFLFVVRGKEFKVHKVILGAASEVFVKLFTADMAESRKSECKVNHLDPNAFGSMLRFIYGGKLPQNFNAEMAQNLYETAHYYDIKTLERVCEQELLGGLNVNNALNLYNCSHVYELEELKQKAWVIIKRDLLKIFSPLLREPMTPADIEAIMKIQAKEKDFWKNFELIEKI